TAYFCKSDKKRVIHEGRTETVRLTTGSVPEDFSMYITGHFQHGRKGTNGRAIQRLAIHWRYPQRKNEVE
ncbi:hypothetical protein, partial [Klebsiella pneumoniae]|uniref:hypothetical protein n=1 Tax=Klebsiella pneumoniae TaxID=573 RepID=UPI001AEF9E3B